MAEKGIDVTKKPGTTTVVEALQRYKREVSVLKKGLQNEIYRIDQICRGSLALKDVASVTSADIATYRDERLAQKNQKTGGTLSNASVRLELSLLSNFFDICQIEWGLCRENPVARVRKPKPAPGRDRRLTPREGRHILRYAYQHSNQNFYSILVLALETAMRQGEILGLHWEHINLKTRIAHLPMTKNGCKRDVPLSVRARDALIRMGPKSSGRVFSYTKEGLKSTWRYMVIKLGIEDLHFHDLRHEACSRLFELGTLDVMEVAAISGHKSLAMLKRYTHLKAQKLVKKLEGTRSKGRQAVIDNLVPYPAVIEQTLDRFVVKLLDFDNLVGVGFDRESAIRDAQNVLMRRILQSLRDPSMSLPEPDQYLDTVENGEIVMVEPL
jgi:integrase